MIDESKRSLRVRKNPKYLNSDVLVALTQQQDPDKVSFSQLKSHQDYSSAQYQKTQDAKALAKLINKANKSFRTYRKQVLPKAMELQKIQPVQKCQKGQNEPQTSKKVNSTAKQSKKQSQTKNKPTNNFKGQSSVKDSQTIKNTQSYINKLKQMGSIPSVSGMGKGLYTDQLKKLQSLYPDMKNMNYQALTQNTNPNLFSTLGNASVQEKNKKQAQPKNIFSQEKLFKRSAYHVAIAYHIYLKNLKQKGGVIGNQIDPTYYAKKLKETKPMQ